MPPSGPVGRPKQLKLPGQSKKPARETVGLDIRALRCHDEVRRQIVNNVPLSDVATYVQDEQHEGLEIQRDSLIRALMRYRDTIPPIEFVEARGRPGTSFTKAVEVLRTGLDEVKEIEELYKIQMERVRKLKKTEDGFATVNFPGLTQDVRVALELLNASAKLKMELGITEHHLGKTEVDVNVTVENAIAQTPPPIQRAMRNPESVHRVLAVLNRARSVAVMEAKNEPHEPVVVAETQAVPS